MNGNVHYWIVCDAVRFVREHGNSYEKNAFQAWETAYGGGDLNSTPYYQSRIEDIIGQESLYTDRYQDLALYLESWAGFWQGNITEYDGYIFTALNHFLAVPWNPTDWWRTNGYYYYWSSQIGNDALAMTGKVDYKDAEVDNGYSPIIDRVSLGWTGGSRSWSDNWEWDIRYTMFAPASLLAYYYYWRLLRRYFTYVDVNGQRSDGIAGLYLLGPVIHAASDACVPQHVISAMDYKHQEWESFVETGAFNWSIDLEPGLVRDLLDNHMVRYHYTGGDLQNMFAIDYVISELCGWKTFIRFLELNSLGGVDQMRSESFWNSYMANPAKVESDAQFFYNLAVAAAVRIISEACYDVIATGGGGTSTPKIRGISSYTFVGGYPPRKPKDNNLWQPLRPLSPYLKSYNVLGFYPRNWRPLATALAETRLELQRWLTEGVPDERVVNQVGRLERELLLQFAQARQEGLTGFQAPKHLQFPVHVEQIRQKCGLPPVSENAETRPLFGLTTFRLPTEAEYKNADQFATYLKESEANRVNAKLISLTRCIALHKFLYSVETDRIKRSKLERAIEGLERTRGVIIRSKRIPYDKWVKPKIELKPYELTAARPMENVVRAH